jgi:hypothetical protein
MARIPTRHSILHMLDQGHCITYLQLSIAHLTFKNNINSASFAFYSIEIQSPIPYLIQHLLLPISSPFALTL